MLTALIWLAIIVLLWFVVDYFGPPEPINKLMRFVLIVGAVVIVIRFLLSVSGGSFRLGV